MKAADRSRCCHVFPQELRNTVPQMVQAGGSGLATELYLGLKRKSDDTGEGHGRFLLEVSAGSSSSWSDFSGSSSSWSDCSARRL